MWVAGPGQVAPDVRGAGGGGGPQGADQGAGGAHARRGVREQGPAQRRHPGDPGQAAAAAASAAEPAPAAVHDRTHPFHLLITTRAPCRLVLDSFRSGPVRCARPPARLPACPPACLPACLPPACLPPSSHSPQRSPGLLNVEGVAASMLTLARKFRPLPPQLMPKEGVERRGVWGFLHHHHLLPLLLLLLLDDLREGEGAPLFLRRVLVVVGGSTVPPLV